MSDDTEVPARWLSNARRAAGLSQERLGGMVGVNLKSIGNYEQGRANVPPRLVPALARALGRDVGETYRALGILVDNDDSAETSQDVVHAILSDARLVPEAKDQLVRQYHLLLRIDRDAEALEAGMQTWERDECMTGADTSTAKTGNDLRSPRTSSQ